MTAFTASNGALNYFDAYTGGSVVAALDTYAISNQSTLVVRHSSRAIGRVTSPPGVKKTDWDSYNSPAKYRIAEVLGKADQPLITMPIAEQSRVCRSTAGRILRIMELMGEARNVGVKNKAKWERV